MTQKLALASILLALGACSSKQPPPHSDGGADTGADGGPSDGGASSLAGWGCEGASSTEYCACGNPTAPPYVAGATCAETYCCLYFSVGPDDGGIQAQTCECYASAAVLGSCESWAQHVFGGVIAGGLQAQGTAIVASCPGGAVVTPVTVSGSGSGGSSGTGSTSSSSGGSGGSVNGGSTGSGTSSSGGTGCPDDGGTGVITADLDGGNDTNAELADYTTNVAFTAFGTTLSVSDAGARLYSGAVFPYDQGALFNLYLFPDAGSTYALTNVDTTSPGAAAAYFEQDSDAGIANSSCWVSESGTLTITSFDGCYVSYTLNAIMVPVTGSNGPCSGGYGAVGSFSMEMTGTALPITME